MDINICYNYGIYEILGKKAYIKLQNGNKKYGIIVKYSKNIITLKFDDNTLRKFIDGNVYLGE